MPLTSSHGPEVQVDSRLTWLCRLLTAVLILGAAVLHLVYLAHDCPLDLAPDEAHYWDWSRNLDWSYYSKGPLVAWLIRASCELFGGWSEQHTGSLTFAVRLPAVLCGSLLVWSVYLLTVQVYQRPALALGVVAVAVTMPLVAVGSSIMTIDAPYTCCWGWALVLGHRAIFRGSWWAWPLAGLFVGLGVLAKYTMIVWIPSVALFLLISPEHRHLLFKPGFWSMVLITGLCCLPILVWNLQHDGVTFRHVSALAGLSTPVVEREAATPRITWMGPLNMVGGQGALLLGFWFIFWAVAMVAHHPWRDRDPGVRYLWCLSAPMFLMFFAFSFKTGGGEVNWPVTAYISGLVLTSPWVVRQLESPSAFYRRWSMGCLTAACLLNLFLTVFMHRSDLLYPALDDVVGAPSDANPYPMRNLDPTCRLRGWRTLAAEVDRERARLQAEGVDHVLAGCNWTLPGELGVYCQGHPTAYSIGLALHDRHSQYDLWPGPLNQPEAFLGKTFVLVGGITPEVKKAFDEVEPTRTVHHEENGRPIAGWMVTVCRGYRGLQFQQKKVY